jgi:hypothetical protein
VRNASAKVYSIRIHLKESSRLPQRDDNLKITQGEAITAITAITAFVCLIKAKESTYHQAI